MKLNKVLSLVVAIAMLFTMTTFAAYSDVKSDASYSEAVDVLSALKILDGYEDGSFKPDGKITRGEFSKVVAGAIGMAESAKANQAGGIFKDVAADLWSSGYIATAYQAGIVNGMGDGTFAPEAEVTYDQAVKMLVAAIGYTPKATALGGYPTGYMMVANQEGITVGTANAAGGASRATVARLVYNALTVPMMDQTSFGTDAAFEAQLDQSLLYTKLNVVQADVVISELSFDKTNTDITIDVKKTADFDDVAQENNYIKGLYTVDANGVDLKGLQGLMVSALIDISDDSELKLLAVAKKAGKNKELVVDSSLLVCTNAFVNDDNVTVGAAGYLTYYKTSDDDKTSKEQIEDLVIYNNLEKTAYTDITSTTTTDTDVASVNKGDVDYKFVDTDNNGKYDTVFVTNIQSFVIGKTFSNTIYKNNDSNAAVTDPLETEISLELDPEERGESIEWSLKDAAGKDLTIADLKAGQVLNYKFSDLDVEYYDITVTDEKVEGAITESFTENNKVTGVAETFYKIGDKSYKTVSPSVNFKLGDSIVGSLSADGKIINYTVSAGVRNYAIALNSDITSDIGGIVAQVQIMTQKGEIVTLDLAEKVNGATTKFTDGATESSTLANFTNGALIAYELNSSNEIKNVIIYNGTKAFEPEKWNDVTNETTNVFGDSDLTFKFIASAAYTETSEKLDSNYITDSTVILSTDEDATVNTIPTTSITLPTSVDKEKLTVLSKSALVDGEPYTGIAVKNADKEYQLLILFGAASSISYNQYPLVVEKVSTTQVEGVEVNIVTGWVNGEADKKFTTTEDMFGELKVNDVALISLNGAGEITNAKKLASGYSSTTKQYADYYQTAGVKEDNKITNGVKGFGIAGVAKEVVGRTLTIGTADYTLNPNAIAYMINGLSGKVKVTSPAALETDELYSKTNDDKVYFYNYDGDNYFFVIIDTEGDN